MTAVSENRKGEKIMKKRSLWILLISALLCFSMLLAACDSGDTEEPTESGNEMTVEAEEPIPEDEDVDYSSILSEWTKYLSSVGTWYDDTVSGPQTEYGKYTDYTSLFTQSSDKHVTFSGKIATTWYTSEIGYYHEIEKDYKTYDLTYTNFYNLETGRKLFASDFHAVYNRLYQRYTTTCTFAVLGDAIIEMTKTVYTNQGTADDPEWKDAKTYTYYRNDGKVIVENTSEKAVNHGNVITIGEVSYHCYDGEIVLEAGKNDTYNIPHFEKKFNGYSYSFEGGTVQVANSEGKLVVNYDIPAYISGNEVMINVLANGDVYLYYAEQCADRSEDHDYETADGEKFKVWHIIVSVSTGEAKTVDAPFVMGETFASNFNIEKTGLKLNGDYQYAEIYSIKDGKIANDVEFVILDNDLAISANLPLILKNQVSVDGQGNGNFVVYVDNVEGTRTSYIADSTDISVTRYVNWSEVDEINNGFISDNRVYNSDFEMICDLSDAKVLGADGEKYYIVDGNIYFEKIERYEIPETEETSEETTEENTEAESETETETEEETETREEVDGYYHDKVVYAAYIDSEGDFVQNRITANNEVEFFNGFYVVRSGSSTYIYNTAGSIIYSDYYSSSRTVSILREYDDCAIIKITNNSTDPDAVVSEYIIIK